MPIEVWSVGDAHANMDEEILVGLAETVNTHPWWTNRLGLTLHALAAYGVTPGSTILNAGCGWGLTYLTLQRLGHDVTGLDISRRALEKLDAPGRRLVQADLTRPLQTSPAQFDCATMLDVIEHIDDDRAAVRGLAWLLKPGGLMIVSVPALPELFGEFDQIQGHRRRYTPDRLRDAFAIGGVDVLEVYWWGELMKRLIGIQRRNRKGVTGERAETIYERYLAIPGYPIRWALDLAMAWDRRRARTRTATTGTSLWAIARKRGE